MISDFVNLSAIEAAIEEVETTVFIASKQRIKFVKALERLKYRPIQEKDKLSTTTFRKKTGNVITQIHLSECRDPSSPTAADFCFIHKKLYILINDEGKEVQHREQGKPALVTYHINNSVHLMSFRTNGLATNRANFDGLFFDNLNFIERHKSKVSFYFFMKEYAVARLIVCNNAKKSIQALVYLINGREYDISEIKKVIPSIKNLPLQEKIDLYNTHPDLVHLFEMLTV